MTQHTGLPVAGYKPQSDEKVQIVNGFKQDEERILRKLDELQATGNISGRWLAIGRTQLEQAFMAINRAVFQPGRVELPEDTDVSVARGTNPDGSDFVPTEFPKSQHRQIYRDHDNRWRYSDTDDYLGVGEIAAYERAGVIK